MNPLRQPVSRLALPQLLSLGVLVLSGCTAIVPVGLPDQPGDTDSDPDGPPDPTDPVVDPDNPPTALLEVYALDIWAQALPEAEATLSITRDGQPVAYDGWPVATVPLYEAGTYTVSLQAPEHEPLELSLVYDGSADLNGLTQGAGPGPIAHGLSLSHDQRAVGDVSLPTHTAYLGLRHKWFSAQARPARRGNDIEMLMDGEEGWAAVYADIASATDSVMITTWWWQSDFELVRPANNHHLLSSTARWQNTVMGVLESVPAVNRVLIGEFWGSNTLLDGITTDSELEAYAQAGGDDFEVMGQGNPTYGTFTLDASPFRFADRVTAQHAETGSRAFDSESLIQSNVPSRPVDLTLWPVTLELQIASYHQKLVVVDQEVAHVSGMNLKEADWDTSEHLPWEHRRMDFDATTEERQEVRAKEEFPDNGPRKDYTVRIEGPAVQDVVEVFHDRWSYEIAQGSEFSNHASDFDIIRNQTPRPNGSQIQVTTTMPEPFWEHGNAESWLNAVAQAEDFIFIEDQFWRSPMLTDAIIARMEQVPNLKLLVVTQPVDEWVDAGCAWTHRTHQQLQSRFPGRYATYQLRSFDTRLDDFWLFDEDETEAAFFDMYLHSKMFIVDDKFMSVGSCNKNNRGLVYEGEMNVAILDQPWVRSQRRRLFANMLPPGTPATDDTNVWWDQFENAAGWNDAVFANWEAEDGFIDLGDDENPGPLPDQYTPRGMVYGLEFGVLSDCLFEDVGPDMM